MSRLKRLIQTAGFSADAHCADMRGTFKQKRIFHAERGLVVLPQHLVGQAFWQKGSIILARPFAKKFGISLCGKLCSTMQLAGMNYRFQINNYFFI
ncbi:hypothetical protein [Paraburkholderia monticola]|uniref:hypothetical protein n=1 Tax=Paraburkholderia monticola TaxID=1399968 RepID=UPI0012900A35|nr:hypothetical protein [Paraburkholderia monticola]